MHNFNKKLISLLLVVIIIVSIIPTEVYAYDIQPYKGDFNIIAYSVLDNINDAPINTAEHYRICCAGNYPFTSIKGDVRLTSDNRIIMCHDQGYTLNSKGRIVSYNASNSIDIHNLSYRQCMSLKYAQKYKGDNIGVCDFETYIKICSNYNKQAFITIRDQYIPEILRAMMPIIYKYNMQSKCIINSFSIDSLRIVKKYDSNIPLSWVIGESGFSKTSIDEAKKLGNCMISLYSFPTDKFGGFDTLDSHIELFSYAQREAVPIYVAIVESVSYIDQLKKYGISGAQVRSLNKTETQETEIDYLAVYEYDFYVNKYPDIKRVVGNNRKAAFEHFLEYGMREGRKACSNFNVNSYKNRYGDLRTEYKNDLPRYYQHYILFGKNEGRIAKGDIAITPITQYKGIDYSAVYDYKFYITKYPELNKIFNGDDVAALMHFINYGMKEGRQACANFDVKSYKNRYGDLRTAYKNDLPRYYKHYILFGKNEGRIAIGDITITPITQYKGIDYSAVYDYNYYITKYPELNRVFGGDDVAALMHFIEYGMKEGRQAKASYNIDAYRSNYLDLQKAFGGNNTKYYLHYIKYGEREKRNASYTTIYQGVDYKNVFDAKYYADKYPDLKRIYGYNEMALFKHFISHGMKEGRQASESFNVSVYREKNEDLHRAYGMDLARYYKHYVLFGKNEGRIATEER